MQVVTDIMGTQACTLQGAKIWRKLDQVGDDSCKVCLAPMVVQEDRLLISPP